MKEDRFVGREDEINEFKKILENPFSKHRVMFVWGPGGVGKTWLIQQMLDWSKENKESYLVPSSSIDMFSTSSQHIEGVMDAITKQLKPLVSKGVFDSFDEANKQLQDARDLSDYSSEGIAVKLEALQITFRDCINQLVKKSPVVLALDTFEHVHNTPVEDWVMSENGLQIPGLICIIAGRTPNPMKPSQPQLGGLSDEEAFALYDSYTGEEHELTPQDKILIRKLNEKAGRNPLLLGLAFSWLDYNSVEELETLTQIEFEKNIASWFHPSRGVGSLYSSSGELGEAVGQTLICMAYLNRRFNQYFLNKLVEERFVIGADASAIWEEIDHNLYKSREFFFVKGRPKGEIQLHDKLAEMLRLFVLPDVFDDLTGNRLQQFAAQAEFWYNDLIEKQKRSDRAKNIYRTEQLAYSLRLDILNDRQRLRAAIEEEEGTRNKELELIDTRLKTLLPPNFELSKAMLHDFQHLRADVLDRLVINLLGSETIAQFSISEQYEFCILLGDTAQRINALPQAQAFWGQAEEAAKKLDKPDLQVKALIELANSTWPEDIAGAITILKENALPVAEKKAPEFLPKVLHDIGIAYRRMYALDEAIRWYEKSQEKAREYTDKEIIPSILNDMGYALWIAWNDRRAKPLIEKAAELRELRRDEINDELSRHVEKLVQTTNKTEQERLQQQLKVLENRLRSAEIQLGLSYNTLGLMARYEGDYANSIVYHDEALLIFENQNNIYLRVEALHSRGDTQRQWAKNLYVLGRQIRSLEYDEKAFADINTALSLCKQVGFVGITPRVLRRMGRLLHDRYFRADDLNEQESMLNKALGFFEQSLELARKTDNTLEELETLTEIAFLGDDLSRIYKQKKPYGHLRPEELDIVKKYVTQFRDGIEAHRKDVPKIYQFDVFDNLLKMEEAALAFESGQFDDALETYLESFTNLARDPGYGVVRCRRHFDHLFENIRRLKDSEREEAWCRQFINRWQKETMIHSDSVTLEKAHPDLFERFELHIDMGFMYS